MSSHTKTTVLAAVALGGALTVGALPTPAQAASVGYVRKVTAIGDSYPYGAMGNEHNSYVERYARRTAQPPLNRSFSGWKTGDVLYQFRTDGSVLRNIRDTRTVIVTIGANDISEVYSDPRPAAYSLASYQNSLGTMRKQLNLVLWHVSKARGGSNGRVVVTTYNNIYADGSALNRQGWEYAQGAENLTRAVNSIILQECNRFHMACVDVYPAFNASSNVDSLVTSDGTHPNSAGHQLYANLIYNRVH